MLQGLDVTLLPREQAHSSASSCVSLGLITKLFTLTDSYAYPTAYYKTKGIGKCCNMHASPCVKPCCLDEVVAY